MPYAAAMGIKNLRVEPDSPQLMLTACFTGSIPTTSITPSPILTVAPRARSPSMVAEISLERSMPYILLVPVARAAAMRAR